MTNFASVFHICCNFGGMSVVCWRSSSFSLKVIHIACNEKNKKIVNSSTQALTLGWYKLIVLERFR